MISQRQIKNKAKDNHTKKNVNRTKDNIASLF